MTNLIAIKVKCEQYWNERGVCDEEVHAILEFIHARTIEAQATVEEVRAELKTARADAERLRAYLEGNDKDAEIEELKATIEKLRATPIGRGLLPPDRISLGELCELRDRAAALERYQWRYEQAIAIWKGRYERQCMGVMNRERLIESLQAELRDLKARIPPKPEGAEDEVDRLIWLMKPKEQAPFEIEDPYEERTDDEAPAA